MSAVFAFCFVETSSRKIRMSGSAKSCSGYGMFSNYEIPNIPQCTLPPCPIYQTLLSIFLGTRLTTAAMNDKITKGT